jgi:hypothetical protein
MIRWRYKNRLLDDVSTTQGLRNVRRSVGGKLDPSKERLGRLKVKRWDDYKRNRCLKLKVS